VRAIRACSEITGVIYATLNINDFHDISLEEEHKSKYQVYNSDYDLPDRTFDMKKNV